jgi:hypothetical protein
MQQNSYPLRDWHFEHMQKTIVKFISGLSELESGYSWKKKTAQEVFWQYRICPQEYTFDIKHGVTEVITFLA